MKFKNWLFKQLKPVARYHYVFIGLSAIQALLTILLPAYIPTLDPAYWLLSFAGCAFWLITYALLKQVYHADEHANASGFFAWIRHGWQNLVFIIWLVTFAFLMFLFIKLLLFIVQLG